MIEANKRRQTPFIDKTKFLNLNLFYTTLLTVEYTEKAFRRLRKHNRYNASMNVRLRCGVIMAKMKSPGLACGAIGDRLGCSRNFVRTWIHRYNNQGIDAVLGIKTPPGRPGMFRQHLDTALEKMEDTPPRSCKEAAAIIAETAGRSLSPSWARQLLKSRGFRFIKLQPIPGNADPEKQEKWVRELQPVIGQAREGRLRLLFMDAAHFTLEAFTCRVWCRKPLFLKTGAGRNRFNVLAAVDAMTLDIIQSSSMTYVNAECTMDFLAEVRRCSGETPVTIVLDNARYQHCRAVMEKAAELGITLLFLPPYSPNLNIIERLWKYVRKTVLYGRHFGSPTLFHEALRNFFEIDYESNKENLRSLLTLNFQSFKNAQIIRA